MEGNFVSRRNNRVFEGKRSLTLYRFTHMGFNLLRDIFVKLKQACQNEVHNIQLYWAKYFLLSIDLNSLGDLRKEVISNISDQFDLGMILNSIDPFSWESESLGQQVFPMMLGHYEKSLCTIENFERKFKTSSSKYNHLFLKGICYMELGQYENALKNLKEALHDDVRIIPAVWAHPKFNLSCCCILKGDVEKGLQMLNFVSELSWECWINIGRALYEVGRFDQKVEIILINFYPSLTKNLSLLFHTIL